MTAFYTRKGDDGFTSTLGEGRVAKSHERIDALGAIDEVTTALGMARSLCQAENAAEVVTRVQRDLYALMSEVAAEPEVADRVRTISESHITWLEENTDFISAAVGVPKGFILPGETTSGAAFGMARAITRRAERRVVALHQKYPLANLQVLRYLNRLSSLCFVLELQENQACGKTTTMAASKKEKP